MSSLNFVSTMLNTELLSELPPITAVIATRNRGERIVPAVQSILQNDYPDFKLVIIDQSEDDLTEKAIKGMEADSRLCYMRSSSLGLGVSHNLAISQAATELIAITDDDCEVPPDWLLQLARAFNLDSRLGMVFGNVLPSDYDVNTGYIPEFYRDNSYLITDLNSDLFRGMGIGACMALRKSAWEEVHGFDQMLGPGSPLGSLEDRDMAIRMLLAGYYVYHTPSINVIHYGFRYNNEVRELAFGDWFGFGSSYAKYLKSGHWALTRYMVGQMWWGEAVRRSAKLLLRKGQLRSITPVVTFWVGFVAGLITRVDKQTGHFAFNKVNPTIKHYRRAWTWVARNCFAKLPGSNYPQINTDTRYHNHPR